MNVKLCSLSKSKDFKSLLNGKKITCKYVTIFFKKLSQKSSQKLNISFIAKKKLGNAIIRNKIKRRLKNIMLEAIKFMKINYEYSYLFIAKKNVFHDEYILIKKEIIEELKKIK